MKSVALFPSAFHPSLGGVEELTGQLAIGLHAFGVKPFICVNRWPRNLPAREFWRGIDVRRHPFRLPEGGGKAWATFRATAAFILGRLIDLLHTKGAELIHVQCVSSNAWYAIEAARALGIPLVVSLQGERTMDATGIYQRSPLFNRLLKRLLATADQITACSHSTLADAAQFNGESLGSRARVVHNGIGPESFEAAAPRQNPRPYILGYGRLVKQKGFDVLLHAFKNAALREVDLLIAGDGPEREPLSRLARGLGLEGQVQFVGRAGRIGVQSLLHGAVGVVVPSLREPMGIVTLETMAAGKPLLASCVDGIPEVAPAGPGVRHFTPGDAAELSVGLSWLLVKKPPMVAESLRERARKFEWSKIIPQYREVYADALRR